MSIHESLHTIDIGAGQAGLATGYYLSQLGVSFAILDSNPRTGDAWRSRWDSLRLFTPSQNDGLPGSPFPQPNFYFPTKDEVADYLEGYARQYRLPVHHGLKAEALYRNGQEFHLAAGPETFSAKNVVVATGPYQVPKIPAFARELDQHNAVALQ